jgi:hypothetical protein
MLWLILEGALTRSADGSGPIAAVYDVLSSLGTGAIVAALAFVGYMVGSLLQIDTQGRFAFSLQEKLEDIGDEFALVPRDVQWLPRQAAKDLVLTAKRKAALPENGPAWFIAEAHMFVLGEYFAREAPYIATKLRVGDGREMFDEYDRLVSEADLRVNLCRRSLHSPLSRPS